MNIRPRKAYAAALVAAASAAAASAAPAGAAIDPSAGTASVVVAHRDLDLSRPEGRAVLEGRLRAAARLVCGAPERGEARTSFARRACFEEAIARAVREISREIPLGDSRL